MYQRILVPVEHSDNDEVVLQHVRKLARTCNDASIVLIHVSEGWVAMATHGHRGLSDIIHGSVASELRHISMLPVLMVRGHPPSHPSSARPTA
jgi:nucleotide-binding universal stress UspA family protein